MEYRDQTFENQPVELDGNVFTGCTFRNCQFVFRGAGGGYVAACRAEDCGWKAAGAAANTLQFLSQLYHNVEGGRELVENVIFAAVRKGV